MTLTPTGDNVVSASFGTVSAVSNSILELWNSRLCPYNWEAYETHHYPANL